MPQYVVKGGKPVEIPREIRAQGLKAVEAFIKGEKAEKPVPKKKGADK